MEIPIHTSKKQKLLDQVYPTTYEWIYISDIPHQNET